VDVDNAGSGDLPDPLAELEQAVANFSDGQPADAGRPIPVAVVQAAVDASTSDAAYASFDEQRKGVLASGMLADIVILSNDIFEDPAERLKDATVAVTIFDGKIVYQRAESN
jgi:predicted amidohydrolase YtcJ